MGFFDKKLETSKEQSSLDWYSTGFSPDTRTLTQIAFEVFKKTPLTMSFITSIVDEEDTEDLRDTLEDLDCNIRTKAISQEVLNSSEIVQLIYTLGVEIKLDGRKLAVREPSRKERVNFLLEHEDLYCDVINAIKIVACIEENKEVLSEIKDEANEEDYTIGEICELANRLSMIKYEDFRLISI